MYKGASQSLQNRHGVDKPHPSRGFIDGHPDPLDILPEIQRMSLTQAEDEKRHLQLQVQRLEQQLAVAKRTSGKDIPTICDQKVITQERLKLVKERIKDVNRATSGDTLSQAIKDIVDRETAGRIFLRAKELRLASADTPHRDPVLASAIEARSDATGTGAAEGESAVPKGDAQ